MGPGAPGGIRTRDLHLERVASWASRRRGPVGIVAARCANSGILPLRAGAVRATPPTDPFAKRRRWTHKCAGGSERHDAAVSGAPTGRLAAYLRAGVARRY